VAHTRQRQRPEGEELVKATPFFVITIHLSRRARGIRVAAGAPGKLCRPEAVDPLSIASRRGGTGALADRSLAQQVRDWMQRLDMIADDLEGHHQRHRHQHRPSPIGSDRTRHM
jgi:hypothetical protein